MALHAHKLLEVLSAFSKLNPNTKLDNGWPISASASTVEDLIRRIRAAPKFEVGQALLDARANWNEWETTLIAMGSMNLLRLPFPEVYVEFPSSKVNVFNYILAWQREQSIYVFISHYDSDNSASPFHTNYYKLTWNVALSVWDVGYFFFYDAHGRYDGLRPVPPIEEIARKSAHTAKFLLSTFLILMATRNVVMRETPEPTPLNKKRIKQGKEPLHRYTTITIDRERVVYADTGGKRTHASPRIHLRRGHIRTLPSGDRTFVKPCIVGTALRGTSVHNYVVT